MKSFDIEDAKAQLTQLVDAALAGEDIVIAKDGVPTVRMVPIPATTKPKREFGFMKGRIWIADDFDGPLPPEVLADFEGR
jgi:prevent-host-death family protein